MDFDQIKDALKFLNWEMIIAIGVVGMATVQFLKEYIPVKYLKLFTLAIGMALAHFIFDIAGVKHTESVALFHGFIGAVFSALGYEMLKGTKLGLRSSTELKDPPKG